ncbi:MAG: Mu transposase domain-containing protein [Methylomonas sp.]
MDRKIVEYFREGQSASQISKKLSKGKGYVIKVRDLAVEYGFIELISADPKIFRGTARILPNFPEALFPIQDLRREKISETDNFLNPHRSWISERMSMGWSRQTVFEELPVSVPRASFYRYIERQNLQTDRILRSSPEIIHGPGECLQVDWAKVGEVEESGRKRTLWAFIGVLGHSRYTMVRLMFKCDYGATVAALQSMFFEMEGCPKKITSDNPKVFVTEASRHEPVLNAGYERFASRSGFTIEALPPADPKKKGKVERSVQLVRRLFESFDMQQFNMENAQAHMDRKLHMANDRKHGTHGDKPSRLFLEVEKAQLKPLPELPYDTETIFIAKVRQDGFVRFLNKYYRVDQRLRGQDAVVIGNEKTISIYCSGRLLEVYDKITNPQQRQSSKDHYQESWERDLQNNEHYVKRAESIGPNVARLVAVIIARGEGFLDTRVIWGILTLDKKYHSVDIDKACESAMELGQINLKTVHTFLKMVPKQKSPPEQYSTTGGKFTRPMSEYKAHLRLVKSATQ